MRYSRITAWWNGRQDGKRNIPQIDQALHSPFEQELQALALENIRRIAQKWEEMDIKLKSEYCRRKFEHDKADAAYKIAKGECEYSEGVLRDAQNLVKNTYHLQHISPFAYFLIMFILGVGEFPLNSIVFDLFGEAKLMTWLMSGVLAVILPLCAHFTGVLIKREPFRRGLWNTDSILLIFAIIVPLIAISAIAWLREKFFEATGAHTFLGVEMSPLFITLTFLGINLLIYFGATIASYFFHDPEVSRARKEYKHAKGEVKEDKRELADLEALLITTNRRLQEIARKRENEFDYKCHEAIEVKNIVERLIQVYRKKNLRSRKDKNVPKSFENLPEIKLPYSLSHIDWDCTQFKKRFEQEENLPEV